ncbi:MAG: Type secretion system domain protein [Acidimicrobiaceae bacterium]|nr:Type secretion system domain protein [Acidimicrobiaceae bacterium]
MSPEAILGGVAGLAVASGLATCVAASLPRTAVPAADKPKRIAPSADPRKWGLAGAAALASWLVIGWPVVGLIVGAAVVGLPVLLGTAGSAARDIARVEAIEEWTRRLADILVVGVGLEQAVATSVRSTPEAIRVEVEALAARLSARWPTEAALRDFANDLADPAADLVVASLILGHRRRGPGLTRALSSVADSVGEEVAMRRRVEADRAKPRTTARAVTLITLGVAGLGALNPTYLRPYGTALGQLVLLAVATLFVGALTWMRSLTLSQPQARLLASAHERR